MTNPKKTITFLLLFFTNQIDFTMKHFIIIILVCIIASCSNTPQFKLALTIQGSAEKAFLEIKEKGKFTPVDSIQLVDGKGLITGSLELSGVYYIGFGPKSKKIMLFLENSEISVHAQLDSLDKAEINGSELHDQYKLFQTEIDKLNEEGMAMYNNYKELVKEGQQEKADSLMKKVDAFFSSIDDKQKEYIKSNPSSVISPFLLSRIYYEMEADVLDEYLKGLDPKLATDRNVVALTERVVKLRSVAIGMPAPDFEMADQQGNPVRLSDIYKANKFTLIDFWASWCGPCRRENPNVVAVFGNYKDKGFGVFGVSLDNNKEKWLETIEKDQLTWPHVSDLKGWANEAAAIYAVSSIPSNLLIDVEGKIIARNLREEKLREKIAELLD